MAFRKNMHWIDRLLRLVIGAVCIWSGFIDAALISNSVLSLVVGGFGVLNIVSAFLAHCPVYLVAGISSLPRPVGE